MLDVVETTIAIAFSDIRRALFIDIIRLTATGGPTLAVDSDRKYTPAISKNDSIVGARLRAKPVLPD